MNKSMLRIADAEGNRRGRDPRGMSADEFSAAGIERHSPLEAIRERARRRAAAERLKAPRAQKLQASA